MARANVSRMQDLIQDYDTIFLLTCMRELRWTPIMMDRDLVNTLINYDLSLGGWIIIQQSVSSRISHNMG